MPHPVTMRTVARRAIEVVATGSGLASVARRFLGDRVAVLAYHNVVPPEDAGRGDRSLHLPLPRFREQLDLITRTHDVVDLQTAAATAGTGRPRAVITFDDAYAGAVRHALPELVRRGLPATVLVAPSLLSASGTWWDEMAEADLLTVKARAEALQRLAGRAPDVRAWAFERTAARTLPESYSIATPEDLGDYVRGPITLGSHAWAHEHLPSLSEDDLRDTLDWSLQWLRGQALPWVPWLALPYGAGSPAVTARARETGYEYVLAIDGGLWPVGSEVSEVPRVNVPAGLSPAGLELRLSGLR